MTSNRILSIGKMMMFIFSISSLLFVSCSDDDSTEGEAYFTIEDNPTGLAVGVEGVSKSYVVRSNRPWQVVAQGDADWVKPFPAEGEDDGIFRFIVDPNATLDARNASFSFMVDGQEQPVLFLVEQVANMPYITIIDAEDGFTVPAAGGELNVGIDANIAWTYTIEENNWISETDVTDSQITLVANKNAKDARTVKLTVSSPDFPALTQEVSITQSRGSVLLEEDFSWLSYGDAIPYVTSGEKRYDSWTEEEKNRGWYSTPVEVSSNQQIVYARQGFVKLGKTNYGGDMISPKLPIEGTVTLQVTFKAAAYISAGGNVDDRILVINALGAGEASVAQMQIDNIPNSQAEDEAGVVNDIWAEDRSYTFTITGATSDTQVQFLGGAYELSGIGQGKNRIFLDDIKIEIVE
ncbi:BACON domain-containing protein [Fulvivirga ligni]|uniref:BACON domain-containing protein n=1 Tax=Fulvivirga ligni TaxID=2904246 RepID=UPI001F451693|nr:BACON domain-containing protein [Fulvivirga ligni]UII24034.1 BACON domain-containing protein [Fulvivirga ligni]